MTDREKRAGKYYDFEITFETIKKDASNPFRSNRTEEKITIRARNGRHALVLCGAGETLAALNSDGSKAFPKVTDRIGYAQHIHRGLKGECEIFVSYKLVKEPVQDFSMAGQTCELCWTRTITDANSNLCQSCLDDRKEIVQDVVKPAETQELQEQKLPEPSLSVPQLFDAVGFIMEFEGGELGEDEIIAGFQQLINSGLVWQLQGCYGRTAARLIEAGLCEGRRN